MSLSGIRVAQLVGVGTAGYLAGRYVVPNVPCSPLISVFPGFHSAGSTVCIPALALAPPEIAIKQWAKSYYIGRAQAPALAAMALSAYIYLAYAPGRTVTTSERYAYIAAGALTFANIPYTLATMMTTNNELEALASDSAEKVAERGDRVKYLFQKWYKMNLVRAFCPLGGVIVGLLAIGGYFAV